MAGTPVIRAAGGVVWRRPSPDLFEILLVHRPAYDDWSLPKGKAEVGESDEDCALREVEEETGLTCRLGTELASASYVDRKGRPKSVRYWAMEPVSGRCGPHNEVDEVRWLSVEDAVGQLSYPRDGQVVTSLLRAIDASA